MGAVLYDFVLFSYHKTSYHTLSCSAVIPFCEQFWLVWVWLCALSGLVNTPNLRDGKSYFIHNESMTI